MKIAVRMISLGTAMLLISGCGGGLSKGAIEKAIEASFEDGNVCWATEDIGATTFPIRVGFDPMARQSNAILSGLTQSELIDVTQEEIFHSPYAAFGQKVMNIELTEKGKQANVWDKARGFCIGRKAVAEVIQWSEPGENEGVQVSQVSYRWHIVDHPSWLDEAAFQEIDGFAEPVETTAVLRKMNDGWAVIE